MKAKIKRKSEWKAGLGLLIAPVVSALTKGKRKGAVRAGLILALTIAFILVISQTSLAALTFTGRDCQGSSICDVIRRCDASGCTNSFENCQSCGTAAKSCPSGSIFVPRVCDKSSGAAQCRDGTATCPSGSTAATADPHVVLKFNVFTKKSLLINITPPSQTKLAGTTATYKIGIENRNPKPLTFQISTDIPQNWQINIPADTSVGESGKKEVSFRVTSNETAADASYPIIVGLFNTELSLFGTVSAEYVVASRGAPTISVTPGSQEGYPGATLMYNVSVTNNDPADFDPSAISMRAEAPAGFNAVFTPSSMRLKPGETGNVRLDVTSPQNATEQAYQITINATANRLSAVEFIEYKIDFCGNAVCEVGEEGSCMKDCPAEPYISCSGRCETEKDDGLAFSATMNVPFNRFIVCSRNSTAAACVQAARTAATANATSCGIGKACLCVQVRDAQSASIANCDVRCVDKSGAYYMLANGSSNVRSLANYSFACPFVDLPEIIDLRDNFSAAKQNYEKAQSALRETLKNMTAAKRAESQPCVDALTSIIISTADFVRYLNDVIAWPGKMNTTAARARAPAVRSGIESTYNSFCLGASGLLQVAGVSAETVERGGIADVEVSVDNIGNIRYFGYAQCELTGGRGEKSVLNSTCSEIGGRQSLTFTLAVNTTSAGSWRARCMALGSLSSGCANASLHHEMTGFFNISTRDTYIVQVTGSCAGQLNCSVRASQPGCSACSSNGQACSRIAAANGTDTFDCPRAAYGNYTLLGYVLENSRCRPISPEQKNITVRCAGCGDGVVDSGEQCEPSYSNNNQRCSQTQTTCDGRVYGIRDQYGFCTSSCGCSYDQFEFSCTRGQCGAECNDGESRTVVLNRTTGSCSCVQQCGSSCSWLQCGCEPGMAQIISTTGTPFVDVTHSPLSPTADVTLTATGGNLTRIEIYVDGFVVKTCPSSSCILTASYAPGVHGYFARASNAEAFATDPTSGQKSFTIPGAVQPGQNITQLSATSVIVDVSHSPDDIKAGDTVIITAVAHGQRSFRTIDIFVDGTLRKTCSNYPPSQPCTIRATYAEGAHTYRAAAVDVANISGSDGPKDFNVATAPAAQAAPAAPAAPQPGRCYAKIESKNCTYNEKARRYDVSLSASWDNGTHAHWEIEGSTGPKIYAKNLTHTEPLAAPGLKTIKVLVHNESDANLCFGSADIYCGPGTAAGKDIDMIFDVKDVVRTGATIVRIIVVPYKDASNARIMSYTDAALNASGVRIEGNTSLAGLSGPVRMAEDRPYNVYTASTNLAAGGNVSLVYRLDIASPGEYMLLAVANYSGKTERTIKTIKATSCPQAYSVVAVGPSGACIEFTTPCDVPAGWDQVEACLEEEVPEEEDNTLLLLLVLAILIVLAALAYRYRDRLRERLHRERKEKKYAEELPSFEE